MNEKMNEKIKEINNNCDLEIKKIEGKKALLKQLEENIKSSWKYNDSNLERMHLQRLEENSKTSGYEIIDSDPFRKKLYVISDKICMFEYKTATSKITEFGKKDDKLYRKITRKVYRSIKSNNPHIHIFHDYSYFKKEICFSMSYMCDLANQPRTMNEATYNFLSSASEGEIVERLFFGYCNFALDKYYEKNQLLESSMHNLCLDIRDEKINPVELNKIWINRGERK